MGSSAIAISLPFSCILGLLASMTSTTMGICHSNTQTEAQVFSFLPSTHSSVLLSL